MEEKAVASMHVHGPPELSVLVASSRKRRRQQQQTPITTNDLPRHIQMNRHREMGSVSISYRSDTLPVRWTVTDDTPLTLVIGDGQCIVLDIERPDRDGIMRSRLDTFMLVRSPDERQRCRDVSTDGASFTRWALTLVDELSTAFGCHACTLADGSTFIDPITDQATPMSYGAYLCAVRGYTLYEGYGYLPLLGADESTVDVAALLGAANEYASKRVAFLGKRRGVGWWNAELVTTIESDIKEAEATLARYNRQEGVIGMLESHPEDVKWWTRTTLSKAQKTEVVEGRVQGYIRTRNRVGLAITTRDQLSRNMVPVDAPASRSTTWYSASATPDYSFTRDGFAVVDTRVLALDQYSQHPDRHAEFKVSDMRKFNQNKTALTNSTQKSLLHLRGALVLLRKILHWHQDLTVASMLKTVAELVCCGDGESRNALFSAVELLDPSDLIDPGEMIRVYVDGEGQPAVRVSPVAVYKDGELRSVVFGRDA